MSQPANELAKAIEQARLLLEEILADDKDKPSTKRTRPPDKREWRPAKPNPVAIRARELRLKLMEPAARLLFASLLVSSDDDEAGNALDAAAAPPAFGNGRTLKPKQLLSLVRGEGEDTDRAARLVDDLICSKAALSPRIHYNLACYYSTVFARTTRLREQRRTAREAVRDRARRHLGYALEDPALLAWAQRDPSLASLRSQTRIWERMIEQWSPRPHTAAETASAGEPAAAGAST